MQRFLFVFILVAASLSNAAENTAGYNITSLLTDPSGAIATWGGKSVQINTPVERGFEVIFEDLMPGANWAHPALIKVVNQQGAVLEQVKTTRPPEGFSTAPQLWGPRAVSTEIKYKIDDFGGKYKVKTPDKYYAVLINGHADRRHWNDFSFLYRVLTQVYGYNKANIFVADSEFKTRDADLDGSGKSAITYGSQIADIKNLMEMLKTKLKTDDHLVLAINDHGGTTGGKSTIVLYDGEMTVSDFSKLLNDLKPLRVLTMYEQCFSGGFVRPSVAYQRVSMSAAKDSENSWASMDLNFDEWIYHAIEAFARQTYQGVPVAVEQTVDGKISAKGAFAYAVAKDQRQESPLLESYNNTGAANAIGLDF